MATPQCQSISPPSTSLAAVPATITTTTSTCMTETAGGVHVFHLNNFGLLLKCIPVGQHVTSGTFDIGGYFWSIRIYPSGRWPGDKDVAAFLELMSPRVEVNVIVDLSLLDHTTGRFYLVGERMHCSLFGADGNAAAAVKFTRSWLEEPPFLRNGNLAIRCAVTVISEPTVSKTLPLPRIEPPPPGLHVDLGGLLREEAVTDVTFHVGEESFAAHRCVLAARSPVFRAELRWPTKEKESGHVTIQDMKPAVFEAFLHFLYTDTLPAVRDRDLDRNDKIEMVKHLLVAADRYAVERLKQLCETFLTLTLNVHTVQPTLRLAEQHGCDILQSACQQFLEAAQ